MGRPKALLPFAGQPLIVHVVSMLRRLFAEVAVVAAPGQELPEMPVTLVRDEVAYQGPVGGIYYGLRAGGGDAAFVTSCDSPFLNAALISHLLSQASDHDIVAPRWQGRFQPLHAVYRTRLLPILRGRLVRGELKLVSLLEDVRTHAIGEDEIRRFDPHGDTFFNINTPDDYDKAVTRWRELHPLGEQVAPHQSDR